MNEAVKNFYMFKVINGNKRVPITYSGKGTRIPFSPAEDKLLIELHKRYGEDWPTIKKKFNQYFERSYQVLRERWNNYLNPNLPVPFSKEEDALLIAKVNEYGPKAWKKIKTFFPNRNENELKNRWNKIKNLQKGYRVAKNFTEKEISEIIATKLANPYATSQVVTDIYNANHPDKPPKAERSVRNVLTKAKKAGLISKAKINTNQNSQNLTINQNNLHQQNQNVSKQPNFLFNFGNNEDNFSNQDFIPELEDSDNKYFYY